MGQSHVTGVEHVLKTGESVDWEQRYWKLFALASELGAGGFFADAAAARGLPSEPPEDADG